MPTRDGEAAELDTPRRREFAHPAYVASEEMTRVIESEDTYPASAFVLACEWITVNGARAASASPVPAETNPVPSTGP